MLEPMHLLSTFRSVIACHLQIPIIRYAAYLVSPGEDALELAIVACHLVTLEEF